ncbi:hypothetical protein E2C11_16425 [Streptomyces lavendulae]|nr:hypothetical protein [Streptomyces lavendulae]TXJ78592.1 hypothetical protein E2C11_16425 [Streptomyces lavendulae]
MTFSQELRAAADKLRTLAETAQHDLETATYWKPYTSNAWAHGLINGFGGPSSDYAAVLPPTVGLAIAKILREAAALHEPQLCEKHEGCAPLGCQWCNDEDWPCADIRNALTVARALTT